MDHGRAVKAVGNRPPEDPDPLSASLTSPAAHQKVLGHQSPHQKQLKNLLALLLLSQQL